jgi:hypothetical protein
MACTPVVYTQWRRSFEIPINVISASGDIFRGLAAEDSVGRLQKKPVTVKVVTFDDGPRRVLIVVDVNKDFRPIPVNPRARCCGPFWIMPARKILLLYPLQFDPWAAETGR